VSEIILNFEIFKKMKTNKLNIILVLFGVLALVSCSKDANTTIQNGTSGSLAKMIVLNDYLYVIDNKTLSTFDISNAAVPISTHKVDVGFGIETLFPFANYLFIGSSDGLYIYDISNPASPKPAAESQVSHFTACDPVVANANYAYVTLNSLRTNCGNTFAVNELQIVNVQNILQPFVENIMEMKGPKGLGIDGNHLFICEENIGVVVYDLTNPLIPNPIDTLSGFVANDVIAEYGNLMIVCEDGLRQFDYSDINNISFTSYLNLND